MRDEGQRLPAHAVHVAPLGDADVEAVVRLAGEVWRHHYPGIISTAQIEYMLQQRYDPALIRAELLRDDVWWDKLVADQGVVAFSSYFIIDAGKMKLDKLYVHPDWQRRGCGAMLIARICARARTRGCREVVLAVNRRNHQAIAAYLKHGFRIREARVSDIGDGFVMDDYIMVRQP
jgi:GNAT superfamily N-acetyltransferase